MTVRNKYEKSFCLAQILSKNWLVTNEEGIPCSFKISSVHFLEQVIPQAVHIF